MGTHRWHFVDETERRKWQDPEAILSGIGIKPGSNFLDIGCGEGFFTLPAARLVGPQGHVYAADIDAEAIERLKQKAQAAGLLNIDLTVGPAEDLLLCWGCADVVFFGIVLHDFQNADRVLENARQTIKPDGRLVNLDWKKTPMSFGPPLEKRFDEATASQMIEKAGFQVESVRDSGPYHYLIIASPA